MLANSGINYARFQHSLQDKILELLPTLETNFSLADIEDRDSFFNAHFQIGCLKREIKNNEGERKFPFDDKLVKQVISVLETMKAITYNKISQKNAELLYFRESIHDKIKRYIKKISTWFNYKTELT